MSITRPKPSKAVSCVSVFWNESKTQNWTEKTVVGGGGELNSNSPKSQKEFRGGSWKANMIRYFSTSHQTQLSMPAGGVLKRNSLIHIWCSRLSFLQTLANLSSLFTADILPLKQYKFSRQMHLKNKPQVNVRSFRISVALFF